MRKIAGVHLIVDAYCSEPDSTLTKSNILSCFDRLIKALDMIYLGEPLVYQLPIDHSKLDSELDEGGISVIAPITTSHMSLHGWPARGAIMLDIFSCKHFDVEEAIAILRDCLKIKSCRTTVVNRQDPKDNDYCFDFSAFRGCDQLLVTEFA
jgi:S-adenosylmethionine/arginine decarboxylase-like enzyme